MGFDRKWTALGVTLALSMPMLTPLRVRLRQVELDAAWPLSPPTIAHVLSHVRIGDGCHFDLSIQLLLLLKTPMNETYFNNQARPGSVPQPPGQ